MTDRQPRTAEGRMLLALARRREDEVRRLRAEQPADPRAEPGPDVLTEAFRLAVLRLFGRPAPPWRMVRFAARRRPDVVPGRPYSAATAYSVTSWAAGETAAVARLSDEEVRAYAMRLFVAVADELRLTDDELADVIRSAERSAARSCGRADP